MKKHRLFQFNPRTFAFMSGVDGRTIEAIMRHTYSESALEPIPPQKALMFDSLVLWKRMDIVLATSVLLRGIEEANRAFPYQFVIGKNRLSWEGSLDTHPVTDSEVFFKEALQRLYGVNEASVSEANVDETVWFIVDPYKMDPMTLRQIARQLQGQHVAILQSHKIAVPSVLDGFQFTWIPNSAFAPFAAPDCEVWATLQQPQHINIIGAGPRVFPAILGAIDYALENCEEREPLTYEERREFCNQHVHYIAGSEFELFDASGNTFAEFAFSYLLSLGFQVEDVDTSKFEDAGDFGIRPLIQPVRR